MSLLLYGNSLFGDFVYDDRFFTIRGEMRHASYLWTTWLEPSLKHMGTYAHYRPLGFSTFALNFLLSGESPIWFHAVSIVLNSLTCWLLYLLAEKLFRHSALAWCVAVFFAILPIHTEAVAYIKARDEILVAFFGLLAWLAFLSAADQHVEGSSKSRRIMLSVLSAVFSLAAFLSKESALVLPGVLAGSLLLLHSWREVMKAWLPLAFQVAGILAFFGLRTVAVGWKTIPDVEFLYFGQNPLGYMPMQFVPWTAFELFFLAVAKTFVPWNLSATYGYQFLPIIDSPFGSWMVSAGLLFAIVLCSLVLWPRTRRTPLGIGALTFLVLYFPFSKIPIVKGIDFFAERWLYAPSIGLSFIGGWTAFTVWKRYRAFASVVFTAVIVAYLFVLIPRNAVWRNETSLGESMVRDAPNAVISYVLLANNRVQYGRLDEAIDLVTRGLQITRNHIPLHQVAAVVAMGKNRLDVAEQAIDEAERLGEELGNDILRSTLLAKQGRFQESLDHIRGSRWFHDDDFRVRLLLALNFWRLGRRDEAERYLDWDAYLPIQKMPREQKIQMIETY